MDIVRELLCAKLSHEVSPFGLRFPDLILDLYAIHRISFQTKIAVKCYFLHIVCKFKQIISYLYFFII